MFGASRTLAKRSTQMARSINLRGGIVQAISWALKEEVRFAGGQNLTESWDDYPILKFSEVPEMHTRLIGPQDEMPLGAGEISSGPAGAAVVNCCPKCAWRCAGPFAA